MIYRTEEEVVRDIRSNPQLKELLAHVSGRLDDDPGHDLAHCLRVAFWTLKIGSQEYPGGVAFRSVVAAALLHDVVNVPKNSPDRPRASEMSASVARELLPQYGFSPAEIDDIAAAIRDHSFSRGARPEFPLGKALQDADRLESLGVLGIMRTISTGARMGAKYFHSQDPWAKTRQLDDSKFSVDHFFAKLLKLPELMNTKAGRQEAESRAAYMRGFLTQLGCELAAPINDSSR